jgi:putative SOS response-associated peptidase YedK
MCGRFIQIFEPEKIRVHFPDLEMDAQALGGMAPRYNIAPTQDILTVLNTPAPKLTLVHWGLIPFWARDRSMGARMINARAETLPDKPSFKTPFQKRRCIIFSEGFYEWKGAGRDKAPFFIRLKSRQPFGMAGLWDSEGYAIREGHHLRHHNHHRGQPGGCPDTQPDAGHPQSRSLQALAERGHTRR